MKYPVCPIDFLIVELDKKFQDEIITSGGLRLYLDTTYKPEEHVTITGKVLSVPRWISSRSDMEHIVPDARPGDQVLFRYLAVVEMDDHFTQPIHTNELAYNGKSYWRINYQHVLGYIRKGEIVPAAGFMFLEPPPKKKDPTMSQGGIWIPVTVKKKATEAGEAIVKHIGSPAKGKLPLNAKPGDTIVYDSRFVERYTISGKDWLVLRQEYAIGKKITKEKKMSVDLYGDRVMIKN